jgi:hypothetical protein
MHVNIHCSTAVSPPLASYAALLTFGRHEKLLTDCFHIPIPEEVLLMSGVISALESLTRPCNVVVSTPCWALQEEFRTTALDFRERMERLAKVHRILYVRAEQDSTDVLVKCRSAAEEAINQYRRACLVAAPATRILEKAFDCFGVPLTERVEVSEPQQGRGEDGGWSDPVLVSLGDLPEGS